MILNRRSALAAIGFSLFGGFERLLKAVGSSATPSTSTDVARLASRTYSEEGVPMFLACENLAVTNTSTVSASPLSDLNRKLIAAFQRYVGEWRRVHPRAHASDVAKIVEFLADQDFSSGGVENSL